MEATNGYESDPEESFSEYKRAVRGELSKYLSKHDHPAGGNLQIESSLV